MIEIGASIVAGDAGEWVGCLGLFVTDARGSILALTSRELMHMGAAVSLIADDTVRYFGARRSPFWPTDEAQSAASLVAWFCPEIEIPEEVGRWAGSPILATDEMISRKVQVVGIPGSVVAGTIIRTHWFADIAVESDQLSRSYEGLIRIALRDDDGVGAPVGLSGALIVSDKNELIGIVIGRYLNDLIAVPLESILQSEGLVVADVADIRRHNLNLSGKSRFATQEIGVNSAVALIATKLEIGSKQNLLAKAIFSRWLASGWIASETENTARAFEPFHQYFRDLRSSLRNLQLCVLDFSSAELRPHEDRELVIEALETALLDFVEVHSEDDVSVPESQTRPLGRGGSHDYVCF